MPYLSTVPQVVPISTLQTTKLPETTAPPGTTPSPTGSAHGATTSPQHINGKILTSNPSPTSTFTPQPKPTATQGLPKLATFPKTAPTLPNTATPAAVTAGGATYYTTTPYPDFGTTYYDAQPGYVSQYGNDDEYGEEEGDYEDDEEADQGEGEGDYPYDDADESASLQSDSAGYANGAPNYNPPFYNNTNYNPYADQYGYNSYTTGYPANYQQFVPAVAPKKGNAT